MTAITIQGARFEVPEGVLAKYSVGYTLSTEGEASTMRQVLCENLRNNFAGKVKSALDGNESLSDEQTATLQSDFNTYAEKYEFGVRSVGGGGGRRAVDPIEREMIKLAKADIQKAYFAKYAEKAPKETVETLLEQVMEKRHDDLSKRAKAIIRQREASGHEDLAAQLGI